MVLWLIKNGVPYDVAINLDDVDLLAHWIVMGGFEGGKWDWSIMAFQKQ